MNSGCFQVNRKADFDEPASVLKWSKTVLLMEDTDDEGHVLSIIPTGDKWPGRGWLPWTLLLWTEAGVIHRDGFTILSIVLLCGCLQTQATGGLWVTMELCLSTQQSPAWFCYESFFIAEPSATFTVQSVVATIRGFFLQKQRCAALLLLFINSELQHYDCWLLRLVMLPCARDVTNRKEQPNVRFFGFSAVSYIQ